MFFHPSNIPKEPGPDSETLLPPPSPADLSLDSETPQKQQEDRDAHVALKTFLLTSCVYFVAAVWMALGLRGRVYVTDADDFCMRHTSHYSPILDEVKPKWHTVQFNGSFLHENIYRQAAAPEVDEAWEALGVDYRSLIVPPAEAEKAGIRPDQVRVHEVYGGGFIANVEGLHHLHCLNLLRKSLKWNYDYYLEQKKGAFLNNENIVRFHVTHCLDTLRQQLMCVPDVGVLGQVWWQPEKEPEPIPFVDFNTRHGCRDYETIRKWAEAHQLPPEESVDMSNFYQMPKPGDRIYAEIP